MVDDTTREPARDPQDLERLLVSRQRAGDVDGMTALFEPDAVIDSGDGQLKRGRAAIRAFYVELVATGASLTSGIRARPLSVETWRSPRRAFPTAAGPPRSPAGKAMGHGYGSSISTPLHSAHPQPPDIGANSRRPFGWLKAAGLLPCVVTLGLY